MHGRRRALVLVIVVATLGAWSIGATAWAHTDLHDRIIALDAEIAANPNDGDLYLKRAEIHRRHANWPAAEDDYRRAAQALTEPGIVDYYVGRMRLESGNPQSAHEALDRFLAFQTGNANALILRGRALAELGRPLEAADDLSIAIDRIDRPPPDLYLERARFLVAAGPAHVTRALMGLRNAVDRFGPVVTVIQYAIEIESGRSNHVAALDWLNQLPESVQASPVWLSKRGQLLAATGEADAARALYRDAVAALNAMPVRRRDSRALQKLKHDLFDRLLTMGAPHSDNELQAVAPCRMSHQIEAESMGRSY